MMDQIRVEQPWILYADCEVNYNGRATSNLERGNLLIIHKSDGTLLIQGGTLCTPRNYQPPQAIMHKIGNKLISKRKNETICIFIYEIIYYKELSDWSIKKIDIHKTEKDLRDYIVNNIEEILGFKPIELFTEFNTPVGSVDVLAIDRHNTYHIIEVKRGKISIVGCTQLERYSNYFIDIMKNVRDYLIAPEISTNALNYVKEMKQTYLEIDHVSDS